MKRADRALAATAVAACALLAAGGCVRKLADAPNDRDAIRPTGLGFAAAEESIRVRRDVDEGNADFMKGWMDGDAALFAGCFAADGALLRPGGRYTLGRDSIQARMAGTFGRVRMREGTIETLDLHIIGDRAYEVGKWVFAIGTVDSLAAARPDSGYFVEIWRREGGRWKMWRDIGVPRG